MQKTGSTFYLLFFLLTPCFQIFGQEYSIKIKSIGIEDGLTSRNVMGYFQDREGFMWIGTEFGLNRYDGYRVTNYTTSNGKLISNNIEMIAEDRLGNIWLYGSNPDLNNRSSFQILDLKKGKAVRLEEFINEPIPFDESKVISINSYYESPELWIITSANDVYLYNPLIGESAFTKIYTSEDPGLMIHGVLISNGLWYYQNKHYRLLSKKGEILQSVSKLNPLNVITMGANSSGNLYYFDSLENNPAGILHLSNTSLPDKAYEFWQHSRLIGVNTKDDLIWANTTDRPGVSILDKNLNLIHSFEPNEPFFSFPKYLFFDRSGNAWTNHEGRINIVSLQQSLFTNYLTDIEVFGINGYGARGIYVSPDNHLYSNGLAHSVKTNLNTKEQLEFGPSGDFYGNKGDLATLKRLALVTDKEGNLWYTDEGPRIAKYDIETQEFTDYTYSKAEIKRNESESKPVQAYLHWSAHIDKNNKLWLGKRTGLAHFDTTDNSIKNHLNYGQFTELKHTDIWDFHENDKGIWIGAKTGLYHMSLDGEILSKYHREGEDGRQIPFNQIAHIREDDDGLFWLSTKGGGIIKLNTDNGEYQQWTINDGLSDNVVYASFEDEYGFIWVSSNNGIMRISQPDFNVSTYLRGDGLIHKEFNTGSHFQSKDGRIFFGNLDGITVFNPKDFLNDDKDISIKVVSLEKQSKRSGVYSDNTADLLSSKSITLYPKELGFNLSFSLLDFIGSEFNTFSYQIQGIDANWVYIDQPEIRINALPYGDYNLKLRGQGPRGQWSKEISIPIAVMRPFYLRWWFFMLIIFVSLISVYLFIRYRLRNLKKNQERLETEVIVRTKQISEQAEELRQMDRMKSKFFTNVSHELRTPLTLILGPIANLLNNKRVNPEFEKELLRIQRNGVSMSNLVEEILDLSKLDAKKLSVVENVTSVHEFFDVVYKNFQSQASFKSITYDFEYNADKELSVLLDQRLVNRIVDNLLSNAFKFTSKGDQISLKIDEQKSQLIITVTDSGIGISEKDLPHIFDRFFQTKDVNKVVSGGSGIGLAMSKELSELMGGHLIVKANLNMGTTFQLQLPKVIHERKEAPIEQVIASEDDPLRDDLIEISVEKSKVLIVEDNLDMQDFISEILQNYHTISVANNGIEGVEFLTQNKPDIIISDMMMPEMDGLQFLEWVRFNEKTKNVPLLMLTARSAEEDKLEAFTLGVDDYLLKPFSIEELKARLKNLLKISESRRLANLVTDVNMDAQEISKKGKEDWLIELKRITQENVHKVDFNIGNVAEQLGLSERQFQRNLKKITGYTPVVYLKEIRLQMARSYLEQKRFDKIPELSMSVGFTSTPYFSKLYKERFGKNPSEYFS